MAGNPNIREIGKATRFKPGQSGNPGGPRRGLSITRLVRDVLSEPSNEDATKTNAEIVARTVVELAKAGNTVMAPLVWRYVDGEPKDSREMTLRELATQLAERMGLNADELLAAFERDMGAA